MCTPHGEVVAPSLRDFFLFIEMRDLLLNEIRVGAEKTRRGKWVKLDWATEQEEEQKQLDLSLLAIVNWFYDFSMLPFAIVSKSN